MDIQIDLEQLEQLDSHSRERLERKVQEIENLQLIQGSINELGELCFTKCVTKIKPTFEKTDQGMRQLTQYAW